ncbi:MAG: hypothetical protein SW833_15015 [Cyanobacteriota bacterium]|nr:hypothetical protein [Cyanobacteriota bacterium]
MNPNSPTASWQNFQQVNQQEIQTIAQLLAKITNRTSKQIQPLLNALLEQLIVTQEPPFYETATAEEWSIAFREWVDTHRTLNLPTLPNEAISRESIYEERS